MHSKKNTKKVMSKKAQQQTKGGTVGHGIWISSRESGDDGLRAKAAPPPTGLPF